MMTAFHLAEHVPGSGYCPLAHWKGLLGLFMEQSHHECYLLHLFPPMTSVCVSVYFLLTLLSSVFPPKGLLCETLGEICLQNTVEMEFNTHLVFLPVTLRMGGVVPCAAYLEESKLCFDFHHYHIICFCNIRVSFLYLQTQLVLFQSTMLHRHVPTVTHNRKQNTDTEQEVIFHTLHVKVVSFPRYLTRWSLKEFSKEKNNFLMALSDAM